MSPAPMAAMHGPALAPDVRREAFHASVEITLSQGDSGSGASLRLPAGKRFQIEFVAAEGFLPAGQKCLFSVIADGFGTVVGNRCHSSSTMPADENYNGYVRASQPVRLLAAAGTPLTLRVDRDSAAGHGRLRMSVFGYLSPE